MSQAISGYDVSLFVTLSLDSILRRQPGAEASTLAGEVLVLDADGKMVRAFNGTAARVWELLDGDRTIRDICHAVAAEFEASAEAVEADVISFLDYLCKVRLAAGNER